MSCSTITVGLANKISFVWLQAFSVANRTQSLVAGNAIRDLDYIKERGANRREDDLFILQMPRPMDTGRLRVADPVLHSPSLAESSLPVQDHGAPRLLKVCKEARSRSARARHGPSRFACALFGGVILMVPILIMTLVGGTTCALITACSFTAIFAALMACASGLEMRDASIITASYGAVLVVFMGSRI